MSEAASKILLVEDNKHLADLVRDSFVTDALVPSHEVVVARLDEALLVENGTGFDLVFIGADLPNTRSIEAIKSLSVRYPGTPIVVLSRENDQAFASQAIESGARDCLGGDEITAPVIQRSARYAVECGRIQRQLEELRSSKEKDNEMSQLGVICHPADLQTTRKSLNFRQLMDARPKEFSAEIQRYGSLLDQLLAADSAEKKDRINEDLHSLADRLGALNAGPRDAVEIHKAALSQKLGTPFVTDTTASIEEGRLLLLRLMGHLVSYYRRLSWGRRSLSVTRYKSNNQTELKRREKD